MKNTHIWLVAHINSEFIANVDKDLKKYKSLNIKYYIPMVRVLVKKSKNKLNYKEVPFLLNYGFFKIPREKILDEKFLTEFKEQVGCVFSWVRDNAKRPRRFIRGRNRFIKGHHTNIATVKFRDIRILKREMNKDNIYSSEEIQKAKEGDLVTLCGYPYEGLIVTINKIDLKRKKAWVSVLGSTTLKNIEISFENFIYTIYQKPNVDSISKVKPGNQGNKKSDQDQFKKYKS